MRVGRVVGGTAMKYFYTAVDHNNKYRSGSTGVTAVVPLVVWTYR